MPHAGGLSTRVHRVVQLMFVAVGQAADCIVMVTGPVSLAEPACGCVTFTDPRAGITAGIN